jgi:DNA (cytosine-5)-methyltransferase 1
MLNDHLIVLFLSFPLQKLPQFPLPSHDVIVRYWPPPEFEVSVFFHEGLKSHLSAAYS